MTVGTLFKSPQEVAATFNELADKFIEWLETVPRELREKEPAETLVLVFFSEVVYRGEVMTQ